MNAWLEQVLADLRSGRASDLAGSRVAADVAVSDRLINEILEKHVAGRGQVRTIEVTARDGDARVTVKLAKPAFLPPIAITVSVAKQPEFPSRPVLELHLAMPPALAAMAGAGLGALNLLPPGHRLEGNRLLIDVATVLAERGQGWIVPYLRALNARFENGRVVHFVEVEVNAVPGQRLA
jgi:hypothetical protein